jgi:hypothetical protein
MMAVRCVLKAFRSWGPMEWRGLERFVCVFMVIAWAAWYYLKVFGTRAWRCGSDALTDDCDGMDSF